MHSSLKAYKDMCELCIYTAQILIIYAMQLRMAASTLRPVCIFNMANYPGQFMIHGVYSY